MYIYVPAWMGWAGLQENGYVCIRMAESLHCSPEATRILLIGYIPIQSKKFKVWKKEGKYIYN